MLFSIPDTPLSSASQSLYIKPPLLSCPQPRQFTYIVSPRRASSQYAPHRLPNDENLLCGGNTMNLKIFLDGEQKKFSRNRNNYSEHKKHKFYMIREFIKFCLRQGAFDIKDIDSDLYSNYCRFLKNNRKNSARTKTDKCNEVRIFLEEKLSPFIPNPKARRR